MHEDKISEDIENELVNQIMAMFRMELVIDLGLREFLDHSLCSHRVCNLEEASDICTRNISSLPYRILRQSQMLVCEYSPLSLRAVYLPLHESMIVEVSFGSSPTQRLLLHQHYWPYRERNKIPFLWNTSTASGVQGIFAPSATAMTLLSTSIWASSPLTSF